MTDRKSTASDDQRRRILRLLRKRPHNGYELRRAGCYQAPTRVFEFRQRGFHIETSRVVVTDADGYTLSGVALSHREDMLILDPLRAVARYARGGGVTDKTFETLRAECALAGVVLVKSHDERGRECFVVSRWALTKELPDLSAVAEWLFKVTGKSRASS